MTSQTIHVQPGDTITIIADQPAPVVTPPADPGTLFVAGDSWTHFAAMLVDPTVTEIALSGDYVLPSNGIQCAGGSASMKPLTVRPVTGGSFRLLGPGKTLPGALFFGDPDSGHAPYLRPTTWVDLQFDKVVLAQAGVIELRRASDQTFLRPVAHYSRDTAWSGNAAYKSYMVYGSSKSGGGLHRITLDGIAGYGTSRDVSFIQFDSGGEAVSDIVIRNAHCEHMAFALYQNIAGGPYTLSDWTIVDSGRNGNAVELHQGSGIYHNLARDSASGGISNQTGGKMVAA